MTILDLNIGQNVGTDHLHTLESDLAAVAIVFPEFNVSRAYTRIAVSGEHTSCIRLTGTKDITYTAIAGLIDYLCTLTQQEAIPCILNHEEGMYGARWSAGIAGTDESNQPFWRSTMNNLHTACITSNVETHGARWAFDREYNRLIKAGWGHRAAFALACNSTFHRYVGE